MQAQELIQLPAAELEKRLEDAYREQFNLRFQRSQRKLTDTNSLKRVRRDIARLQTVVRQRELAAEMGARQQTGAEAKKS